MSNGALISEAIKAQHANEIARISTFKPQGISEQAAKAFLDAVRKNAGTMEVER